MKSQNLKHFILRSAIALLRNEQSVDLPLDAPAEVEFNVPRFNQRDTMSLLSDDELYRLGVCAIPSRIVNEVVCQRLAKTYPDLSIAGIFKKENGLWLIDVDERFSKGFLLPVRTRKKLIYGFMVYRYPADKKPFFLKSREVAYA